MLQPYTTQNNENRDRVTYINMQRFGARVFMSHQLSKSHMATFELY
jgi:hypothetical protein